MTTTVLNYYESNIAIGERHVHFNLRDSIPTSGTVNDMDAVGEFRVVRNNQFIKSENDILDFSWLGQDGDKVYARFTDKAANKGSWESYTYVVTGTYDTNHYFDNTFTGTPLGTIEAPYNHINYVSAVNAIMTSGAVHAIWLKEGQTFSSITNNIINNFNSNTKIGTIRFLRWGNTEGVEKPIINYGFNNNSAYWIQLGQKDSIQFSSVDFNLGIDSTYSVSTTNLIAMSRNTNAVSAASPRNFLMSDCNVSGGRTILYFTGGRLQTSGWQDGWEDPNFVAINNCNFYNFEQGQNATWIDINYVKYLYLNKSKFILEGTYRPFPYRNLSFGSPKDIYISDVSGTTAWASGVLGFVNVNFVDSNSVDVTKPQSRSPENITINRFLSIGFLFFLSQANGYNTGRLGKFYNFRMLDCQFFSYNNFVFTSNGGANNSMDLSNIQLKRHKSNRALGFYNQSLTGQTTYPAASGTINSVYIYDSIFDLYAGEIIYGNSGHEGAWASGCYHFRNNIYNGTTGRLGYIAHFQMSPYHIVQKMGEKENEIWTGGANTGTGKDSSFDTGGFFYYGTNSVSAEGQPLTTQLSPKQGRDYASSALGVTLDNVVYYSGVAGNGNVPMFVNRLWVSATPNNDPTYYYQQDWHTSAVNAPTYQIGYLPNNYAYDGDGHIRGPDYTDIGPYQYNTLDFIPGDNPQLGQRFFLPIFIR